MGNNRLLALEIQNRIIGKINRIIGTPLLAINCHMVVSVSGCGVLLHNYDTAIQEKITLLRHMGDRLCDFLRHDAILLLRYSFSIPRLIFLLQTAPVFLSSKLRNYDALLCSLLSSLLNIPLEYDSPSWAQASMPVRCGGLGF